MEVTQDANSINTLNPTLLLGIIHWTRFRSLPAAVSSILLHNFKVYKQIFHFICDYYVNSSYKFESSSENVWTFSTFFLLSQLVVTLLLNIIDTYKPRKQAIFFFLIHIMMYFDKKISYLHISERICCSHTKSLWTHKMSSHLRIVYTPTKKINAGLFVSLCWRVQLYLRTITKYFW